MMSTTPKRSPPPQQMSFASYEFSRKKRVTRRERFLAEMEQVVPWARLEAVAAGKLRADIDWHVAQRRSVIEKMADGAAKDIRRALERVKAQVRARVEHPFHVVKNLFRHRKARYKGLAKNAAQLFSLFGLANLVIAMSRLMDWNRDGRGAPARG
jgi:light-regulated signal transduction histidine kinase (bacteriophytochrome)